MKAVNLIPAKRRAARHRQQRVRAWLRAAAAYGLTLAATVLIAQAIWGRADRALADQLADVQQQAEQAQQKLTALEPDLAHAMRKLEASRAVAVQPDWSLLLALLGEVRDDQLALNRINLAPEDRRGEVDKSPGGRVSAFRLELAGVGENQQAVSRFVLRLEQAAIFENVKLVETSRTTVNERNAVAFSVMCRLIEPGEAGDS